MVKHKVFLSYHKDDKDDVEAFIHTFDHERNVFITRVVGAGMEQDIINSNDTDYVMNRIRTLYLRDSTVTIVLMGRCTWARRFVDWEIQSSLRRGETVTPNGLMGIKLPSYRGNGYPNRLNLNLKQGEDQTDCYARVYQYPKRKDSLRSWIEDAFKARTFRNEYIVNPRERFIKNRSC